MDTLVSIELPLPMDVSGTLMRAVGAAYPNAKLVTDGDGRTLTFAISDEDRAAGDQLDPEDVVVAPRDDEVDALLTSFADGTLGMSPPEWFSRMMVGAMSHILDETDAENYLEMTLNTSETSYAVVVCRSAAQTPHSLRRAAEERAERYAAKLRELGIAPEAL